MALLLSLLTTLVVISFGPRGSLGCSLPPNHILLSGENLVLLTQMRRMSLFSCLEDRYDFGFPHEVFGGNQFQKAQAISVVREMTQQTFDLFRTDGSFTAWDKNLLVKFCTRLEQQLKYLETCLRQEVGVEETLLRNEAVRKYFQRITHYLQKKKYSPCAWEIVRVEIMRSFSSLQIM